MRMNVFDRSNTFFALDFDRCLGDVDALYAALEQAVEKSGYLSPSWLQDARRHVEQTGGSFDALGHLRQVLRADELREILDDYLLPLVDSASFLLPGAQEFIYTLRTSECRFGILTYGNPLWQHAKITKAGLTDIPACITDSPYKGATIAGWRMDGRYVLPRELGGGMSDYIILVDDKKAAFDMLPPESTRGYCISHTAKSADTSQAATSEDVRLVQSFAEIVNYEQYILT